MCISAKHHGTITPLLLLHVWALHERTKKQLLLLLKEEPKLGWLKVAFETGHHGLRIANRHLSLTFHRLNS